MKVFGLILLVAIKYTASECLPGTYQTEYSDCEGEYDYSESYDYSEVSGLILIPVVIHILFIFCLTHINFLIFSKLPTGRPYPIPITTTTTTTTTTSTRKTPLTLTTTITSSTAQTVIIVTTKKV